MKAVCTNTQFRVHNPGIGDGEERTIQPVPALPLQPVAKLARHTAGDAGICDVHWSEPEYGRRNKR